MRPTVTLTEETDKFIVTLTQGAEASRFAFDKLDKALDHVCWLMQHCGAHFMILPPVAK